MMSLRKKRHWDSIADDKDSEHSDHTDKRLKRHFESEIRTSNKRKYSDNLCESCLNNQEASLVSTYSAETINHIDTYQESECERSLFAHAPILERAAKLSASQSTCGSRPLTDQKNCFCCIPRKRRKENSATEMLSSYRQDFQHENTKDMDADAEFNSFNFWRPVLPNIEDQLITHLEESMESESDHVILELETENPQFNSFNYWRMPVAHIDFDLEQV